MGRCVWLQALANSERAPWRSTPNPDGRRTRSPSSPFVASVKPFVSSSPSAMLASRLCTRHHQDEHRSNDPGYGRSVRIGRGRQSGGSSAS